MRDLVFGIAQATFMMFWMFKWELLLIGVAVTGLILFIK